MLHTALLVTSRIVSISKCQHDITIFQSPVAGFNFFSSSARYSFILSTRWALSQHSQRTSTIPRILIRTKFIGRDHDGVKQYNQLHLSVVQPFGFINHNFNWFLQLGTQAGRHRGLNQLGTLAQTWTLMDYVMHSVSAQLARQVDRVIIYTFVWLTSAAE